jgi:hypothetical protein
MSYISKAKIPSNLSKKRIKINRKIDSLEKNTTIFNNTNNNTLKDISALNNTNNINQTNPFLKETIKIPIINKHMDTKYAILLGISIPILLILLILVICYYIRKKIRSRMLLTTNSNIEQNKINYKNNKKQSYNRLQNTSGLNNNIGINPNNLSEIKVQNMKEEINNIISNTSGSSSGRRRREKKKKPANNNMAGFEGKEGEKGKQNEIKEQIKQYVIDEHNNDN